MPYDRLVLQIELAPPPKINRSWYCAYTTEPYTVISILWNLNPRSLWYLKKSHSTKNDTNEIESDFKHEYSNSQSSESEQFWEIHWIKMMKNRTFLLHENDRIRFCRWVWMCKTTIGFSIVFISLVITLSANTIIWNVLDFNFARILANVSVCFFSVRGLNLFLLLFVVVLWETHFSFHE